MHKSIITILKYYIEKKMAGDFRAITNGYCQDAKKMQTVMNVW